MDGSDSKTISGLFIVYGLIISSFFILLFVFLVFDTLGFISKILGIDSLGVRLVLTFAIVVFVISSIISFIIDYYKKKRKNENDTVFRQIGRVVLKTILNPYVMLSFLLIIIIIFAGISYIGKDYYPVGRTYLVLPASEEKDLIDKNIEKITDMGCRSRGEYAEYVSNDTLICNFTIDYSDGASFYLEKNKISPIRADGTSGEISADPFLDRSEEASNGSIVHHEPFLINLGGDGRWYYRIDLYFSNFTDSIIFYSTTYELKIKRVDAYENVVKKRVGVILILFSLAFFSTLAGMKNLRDLIEKR